MGACFSSRRSRTLDSSNKRQQNLQSNDSNTSSFSDDRSNAVPNVIIGTSHLTAVNSKDSDDSLKSTSARSTGVPSTSTSEYSNVSTATPTSVLPRSSRRNHAWEHAYYLKVRDLREGSSGSVHLAVDLRYGSRVAIKFIPRGSGSVQIVAREVLNQRLCFHHPHIIQFREVFLTADHFAIVSEYAEGGDLADYIDRHQAMYQHARMTETNAAWLFHQLVTGVNFCHQIGIANRDIKLENTLLMDESERPLLKLCDFGYSKDEYQGSACKTLCGTPEYVAPEVLANESYDGKPADVWSCGVVLYTILTGVFPFRDPQEAGLNPVVLMQRLFPRILNGQFDMPADISLECRDLLQAMLTVDPLQRIPAAQILQHPWMKKFDTAQELAQLQRAATKPLGKGWSMQTDQEILQLSKEATRGAHKPVSQENPLPY